MKKANIVIFGPTHSGKTTLLGYMSTHHLSDDEFRRKEQRLINNLIKEVGADYYPDRRFAYFLDTGVDEINKDPKNVSLGTSKRRHFTFINAKQEYEFLFIDTPGSDQNWKTKYRGLFLGDIGIYIIDISDFNALSSKQDDGARYRALFDRIFEPLYYWKTHKDINQLIIVLSQVDKVHFSSYDLEFAITFIHSISDFKEVEIVPISIDISHRQEHNIFRSSKQMPWLKNHPLMWYIIEKSKLNTNEKRNSLLVHVDKRMLVKETKQSVLRIKVMSGSLSRKQSVLLGPVKKIGSKDPIFLKATVKSLKQEMAQDTTEVLDQGMIGGVILSFNGGVRLADLDIKRTTLIFDCDSDAELGNLLSFEILDSQLNANARNDLSLMKPNERLVLIWFGKMIPMLIVGYHIKDGKWILSLMNKRLEGSLFYMPKIEQSDFIYENFALQLSKRSYASARLLGITEMCSTKPYRLMFLFTTTDGFDNMLSEDEMRPYTQKILENSFSSEFSNITDENINRYINIISRFTRKWENWIIEHSLVCVPQNGNCKNSSC